MKTKMILNWIFYIYVGSFLITTIIGIVIHLLNKL